MCIVPWNTDIEMHLRHIVQVIREKPNIPFIIAGNFSSKPAAGFAKTTDVRSMTTVEDLITANDLLLLKKQCQSYTLSTLNGENNIEGILSSLQKSWVRNI